MATVARCGWVSSHKHRATQDRWGIASHLGAMPAVRQGGAGRAFSAAGPAPLDLMTEYTRISEHEVPQNRLRAALIALGDAMDALRWPLAVRIAWYVAGGDGEPISALPFAFVDRKAPDTIHLELTDAYCSACQRITVFHEMRHLWQLANGWDWSDKARLDTDANGWALLTTRMTTTPRKP